MSNRAIVILPIFKPNLKYLEIQLSSLAAQSFSNFECLVSHDGPISDFEFSEIEKLIPDSRFKLSVRPNRLGLYRHVEELLGLAHQVPGLSFVALCDQDDAWYPDRLALQILALSEHSQLLVTDNALLIDSSGVPISSVTLFNHLGVDPIGIPLALLCNLVTGAGTLLRVEILDSVLPFPPRMDGLVHDHWLYLVALTKGGILFTNEPTWNYRQHSNNAIGALAGRTKPNRINPAVSKLITICRYAFSKAEDPIIAQAFALNSSLTSRHLEIPEYVFLPQRKINLFEVFSLLSPSMLRASRLESLRLLASYVKKKRT